MIFILDVNDVHFSLFVRLDNSIIIESVYERLGLSRILDEPGHAHPHAATPSAAIFIVIIVDHGGSNSVQVGV